MLTLAATGYLMSAFAASRMDPDLLGPDDDGDTPQRAASEHARHVVHGLADGARHVRERRHALHALAAIGAHRFAYGISTIATILLCRNYFNDAADVDAGLRLLALVFAASGAGFAVAALVTPVAARRIGPAGWITTCFFGAAAAEYVFVAFLSVPVLLVGAFALGIAAQGSKICVDTIVQRWVDDAYRGRVFSFYDVVFNAAFVLAALVAVLVVPVDGYSRALYGGIATLYLLTAVTHGLSERRMSAGSR